MNLAMSIKKKPTRKMQIQTNKKLTDDDEPIRGALLSIKTEIDRVNQCIDTATDEALIDSFIYELKALHMKYQFYLTLAKQNDISSSGLVV